MSDILSIVKDQENELKAQVPSFLQQTANSSPSKLLGDYEKTGNPIFKKAAGQAMEFLSKAVQKAKEWTAPKAEALGAGVLFAGMAATPRGRRMMAEEGVDLIAKKLKNTWYGSADEIASVLSKPRMYTPDEQVSLFAEHIQPKLEKLKTPRDDQALVFFQPADGAGGQYVNTRLDEVFHYPVDKNLKVKVVPLSKLKSTGDDAKDAIGYRILDTSGVESIHGEKGFFNGSRKLPTVVDVSEARPPKDTFKREGDSIVLFHKTNTNSPNVKSKGLFASGGEDVNVVGGDNVIEIKIPFKGMLSFNNQEDAIKSLVPDISSAEISSLMTKKRNYEALDEKIAELAKEKGIKSIRYTKPFVGAFQEVHIVDPSILKNSIENKLSTLKKMDGIDARLGVKILDTLDKTYDGSNNLIAAKMLQTYFKSDPKFYSEIVKRTSQSGTPMLGTKDPVVAFIAEQLDMLYGEGK